MKLIILAILIAFLICARYVILPQKSAMEDKNKIIVNLTCQGKVMGNYDKTAWTNQTFMQFRGIPYAESPKGCRRFKPPVARRPWPNTLDATKFGRRCPVISTVSKLSQRERKQDLEDCLNLCVYTKNLCGKQPVMFYVHGGGFVNGSASDHPPKYLLEKDIVLVVVQYRIGVLGWATTLTNNMPGNVAIMDLLLALQWVKKHICKFGGDPENVTIIGQSSGAAIVGAIILSPKTLSGLFHRAIIQSGSILSSWALMKSPREQVERICKALSCAGCKTDQQLHQCLFSASVRQLMQVSKNETFRPIVGDLNGVLPQHPGELIKKFNRAIPIMTGFTKHDGSFALATYYDALKKLVGNLGYITVRAFAEGLMLMANDDTRLSNNLMTKLLFSPDILDGTNHKEALAAYFDLTSIQFMKSPILAFASHLIQKRLAHTFLYSFDYIGEHTRFGYELGNAHYPFHGGVHHSNDIIYLFSTHCLNAADTEVAKMMVEIWTSFAKNSIPRLCTGQAILPMKYENGPYFHINKKITIGHDVLEELTSAVDDPDNNLDKENTEF